jgi:hypothetical protein
MVFPTRVMAPGTIGCFYSALSRHWVWRGCLSRFNIGMTELIHDCSGRNALVQCFIAAILVVGAKLVQMYETLPRYEDGCYPTLVWFTMAESPVWRENVLCFLFLSFHFYMTRLKKTVTVMSAKLKRLSEQATMTCLNYAFLKKHEYTRLVRPSSGKLES